VIRVNIHEAKTNLSKLIERAEKGETIIVCRRNEPVVEMRATPGSSSKRRVFGGARGKIKIPPTFFDPLSDDELSLWEGAGE
jgi:antitoxin (DNA-binding transcriptional repressor) of toxin-antitoxin stability system